MSKETSRNTTQVGDGVFIPGAVDNNILGVNTQDNLNLTNNSSFLHDQWDKSNLSEETDPITEFVREEIIQKKLNLLQAWLGENAKKDEEKEKIKEMTPQEFQEALKSKFYQTEITAAYKDETLRNNFRDIEAKGYTNLHDKFREIENLNWEGDRSAGTRTKEYKNAAGETIINLIETTVPSVTLENGETALNARTINIPNELKNAPGKGGAHFTFTSRTLSGEEMDEPAIRASVHYNSQGKLIEADFPAGLKFMGDDPKAMGYFEHNGQTYTTVVTQGQYRELMIEVAKNNGIGACMETPGQTRSQDTAVIGKDAELQNQQHQDTSKTPTTDSGISSMNASQSTSASTSGASTPTMETKGTTDKTLTDAATKLETLNKSTIEKPKTLEEAKPAKTDQTLQPKENSFTRYEAAKNANLSDAEKMEKEMAAQYLKTGNKQAPEKGKETTHGHDEKSFAAIKEKAEDWGKIKGQTTPETPKISGWKGNINELQSQAGSGEKPWVRDEKDIAAKVEKDNSTSKDKGPAKDNYNKHRNAEMSKADNSRDATNNTADNLRNKFEGKNTGTKSLAAGSNNISTQDNSKSQGKSSSDNSKEQGGVIEGQNYSSLRNAKFKEYRQPFNDTDNPVPGKKPDVTQTVASIKAKLVRQEARSPSGNGNTTSPPKTPTVKEPNKKKDGPTLV